MKASILLLAGCMLWSPGSSSAQSDPISGTWSGDIGLTLTERLPIKFELKFDGKTISGTVTGPGPADLKSGTFDGTTGAFKLEVDVKDDTAPKRFVLEGTAVGGMATGRVSDGSQIGSFRITKAGAESAAGPPPWGSDAAAELRRTFAEVSGNVTKSADLVPADKYTYKPTPSVRTFGQLIGHIADSYNYYCAVAAGGQNVQWADPIEKGKTDKATLLPKLKQALDACTPAYAAPGQIRQLLDNIGHTSLHYGNLITYMRMMGLVPPSS